MSNEIIKVLDNLAERFGVIIDWTAQNVMPYLQDLYDRIIDYRIMQLSIMYIIFIAMLIISMGVFIKVYYDYKTISRINDDKNLSFETYHSWVDDITTDLTILGAILLIFGFVLLIGAIFGIFKNIDGVVEIINIPEKYIYDMIQEMM